MAQSQLVVFILVICGVSPILSVHFNITSPVVTNFGVWGAFRKCPPGRYAQGFQLKVESFQYLGDDTALNAVKLFCGDPYNLNTAVITSTEGDFGSYGKIYNCYPGYLNGFQLRSESNRGSGDDTAANNIRFWCSLNPNDYIEGDGLTYGDWTAEQHCYSSQGICGIRTQVEPNQGDGDDTSLNNVLFECCDRSAKDLAKEKEFLQNEMKESNLNPKLLAASFKANVEKKDDTKV